MCVIAPPRRVRLSRRISPPAQHKKYKTVNILETQSSELRVLLLGMDPVYMLDTCNLGS